MVPSDNRPFVYNYPLVTKRNAKGKPAKYHITGIAASICMDFAQPALFSDLSQRPALILGPARTWDAGISSSMWEQGKTRAAELGSSLLWCDGGVSGISGVASRGIGSAMQLGAGSWIRTIGIEKDFDETRTLYGRYGGQLPLFVIWGVFGVEWLLEQAAHRLRLRRDEHGAYVGVEDGLIASIERIPAQLSAYIRQWRRTRVQQNGGAEVGERTSLL
jgi:predicted amidohydrolase